MKKALFSIMFVFFAMLVLLGNSSSAKNDAKAVEILSWEETDYTNFVTLNLRSRETKPFIAVFDNSNMVYMENGEGVCTVLSVFDDPRKQYETVGYLDGDRISTGKLDYSISEKTKASFDIVVESRSMKNGLIFFLFKQKITGENAGSFFVIMNDGKGSASIQKLPVSKQASILDDYDISPVFFCKAKKLKFWDYTSSEDGTFSDEVRFAAYGYGQSSSSLGQSIFESIDSLFPDKSYTNYSDVVFTFANQGILLYSDTLYIGDETEENIIEHENKITLFADKHCRIGASHSINNSDLEKGKPHIVLKYNAYIPMNQILSPAETSAPSAPVSITAPVSKSRKDAAPSLTTKEQLPTNETDADDYCKQGTKYQRNGDYAAAMGYYRKAADLGSSTAMRMIGSLYQSGDGVAVDYEKALEWYLKAADLGDTTAMHNIGFLYSRGWGVVQDENKAQEWYTKAGDGVINIRSNKDSVDDNASAPAPVETGFATEILNALNDDLFKDTYRALSEGEVIQSGSYGSAVKGLQQTLNAFGQNLGVDGSAGSRTISALNEVQNAFGFEETDTLDADRYSELLSALLLLENPESAAKLLPQHMSRGQYRFMQACALVMQGKNYSARELFEKCSYRDWAKRATDCALPWPATGVIWKDSSLGGGTELTVKVNEVPDLGMYIKIYKDGTTPAAQLFVGGSGSATVSLPSGSYTIKDGTGKTWFGPEESFGRTGSYEIMTFEDGSTETELESGYEYTITVNVTVSLHDAETVKSKDISYDAF